MTKRILRFDQVNESGFDWKSFISRNKKYTIDDLYVFKPKCSEEVNRPPQGKLILGKQFQDLDHAKNLELGELYSGVFRKTDDYFSPFRFGDWREGDIWYDYGEVIDKLKDISINKLDLKVGQEVYIKSLNKNGIIEQVKPLAIYRIYNEVFKQGIEDVLTLAYRIENKWYQATQLEVIKSTKPTSVIDEEIEDNFLEYLDTKQMIFTSKPYKVKDTSGYECKISISLKEPEMLDQISSRLLVMTKRLSNKNINVYIKSIDLNGIVFLAIQG